MKYLLPRLIAFIAGFLCLTLLILTARQPHNTTVLSNIDYDYEQVQVWQYKSRNPQPLFPSSVEYFPLYNAIYAGNSDVKFIYLTFNCTLENGKTDYMLDVLKEKNVRAAFFVSKEYAMENPVIVMRMKSDNHIVGIRTDEKTDLCSLPDKDSVQFQIDDVVKACEQIGISVSNFIRPPNGKYSYRSLDLTNQCGYTTVFWSVSYIDTGGTQSGPSQSKQLILNKLHPGAVILLHTHSNSNYKILGEVIDLCRKKGYQFRALDEFVK